MPEEDGSPATEELTSDQKRANVIRLAFGGSEDKFNEFVNVVRQAIPPRTGVVLRGSGSMETILLAYCFHTLGYSSVGGAPRVPHSTRSGVVIGLPKSTLSWSRSILALAR